MLNIRVVSRYYYVQYNFGCVCGYDRFEELFSHPQKCFLPYAYVRTCNTIYILHDCTSINFDIVDYGSVKVDETQFKTLGYS